MYEARRHPLLGTRAFLTRISSHFGVAILLIALSLLAGTLGYREFETLSWTDAVLHAAMILGGMGPVNSLQTEAGKLFATAYALYSGIVFLVTVGVVFAPFAHRLLHRFHADEDGDCSASALVGQHTVIK